MTRHWTFGQRLGAGFAVMVLLAVVVGGISVYALRSVVEAKDRVIQVNAELLLDGERLAEAVERRVAAFRGFLLDPTDARIEQMRSARSEALSILARLKQNAVTDEGRQLLDALERGEAALIDAQESLVALRRSEAPLEQIVEAFDRIVQPKRDALRESIVAFVERQERLLEEARLAASATASTASSLVVGITLGLVVLSAAVALILTRTLSVQIGSAVGQVQSSASELQAAANQQASGSREQATAMSEITTTISELLATSRQIAESAQRVSQIADQTA
jgi:CHASE3 domain sensor protein